MAPAVSVETVLLLMFNVPIPLFPVPTVRIKFPAFHVPPPVSDTVPVPFSAPIVIYPFVINAAANPVILRMKFNVFAARLKTLRSSRNLTLQRIGDAVKYSLKTVGNLENAQQQPSLNMVLALADFFNVSTDYLIGRKDSCYVCHDGTYHEHIVFHEKSDEFQDSEVVGRRVLNLNVLAPRLRGLRLERRLILQDVGGSVGCHMKTIGNLEKAHKAPSLSVLLALADFFNVFVDYLVGWTDCKTDANGHNEGAIQLGARLNEGQKKLIALVESLHEENVDKALSYITFLRHAQECKDKHGT